jgi:hypothetical protein
MILILPIVVWLFSGVTLWACLTYRRGSLSVGHLFLILPLALTGPLGCLLWSAASAVSFVNFGGKKLWAR